MDWYHEIPCLQESCYELEVSPRRGRSTVAVFVVELDRDVVHEDIDGDDDKWKGTKSVQIGSCE